MKSHETLGCPPGALRHFEPNTRKSMKTQGFTSKTTQKPYFFGRCAAFWLKNHRIIAKMYPKSSKNRTSLTLRVKLPQELHTFLYENLWRKMFAHQVADFRDDFFHLRAEISRIFLKINSFLWIPLYICSSHFKNPWFWQAGGGGQGAPPGGRRGGPGGQGLPWGHSISAGFLVFISK